VSPRDLAIVAAVVALAGFAAADALRDGGQPSPRGRVTEPTVASGETAATTDEERRETFPDVPTGGSLAFTSGDDCRLRDASVSTGLEFPLPRIETNCDVWAPPVGNRLAYGLLRSYGETFPIRFLDLGRPLADLGTFEAFSDVVWSADGMRAAWCDTARTGFDYEVDHERRKLPFCPLAYTPAGGLAHTSDREVLVDGQTVLAAPGHIDQVAWGRDGSLALLLGATRIERLVNGRRAQEVRLPRPVTAGSVVFSPDNCAALVREQERIRLVDVGCFRGRGAFTNISPDNCLSRRRIPRCERYPAPRSFPGLAAAWSPDGEWIAVAELDSITFHRVVGRYDSVRWDASANGLAWR
jgi:hypothetical protein